MIAALLSCGAMLAGAGVARAADASNNTVIVNESSCTINGETESRSGTIGGNAFGGHSYSVKPFYYDNYITGGVSSSGDSSDNNLAISNVTLNGDEIGAGMTNVGNANNNVTDINNVYAPYAFLHGGYAYSGDGEASGNIVNFNGGTVYEIHGGHSFNNFANNNTVNITDGTVIRIIGAGYSDFGSTNYNVLNIYGGLMSGTVHGGYSPDGSGVTSSNNTVNISGGTIKGNVYGGWAPHGVANDNTINIYGSPVLNDAEIYAGKSSDSAAPSGNKLNVHTTDITAKNIYGFEELNFYMPSGISNGSTILTLTDSATDLTKTKVSVIASAASNLTTNDKVTLLQNTSGTGSITTSDVSFSNLYKGVTYQYELSVDLVDEQASSNILNSDILKASTGSGSTKLVATIGNGSINPRLPSIVKPREIIPTIVDPDLPARTEFELAYDSEQKNEWQPFIHGGSRWMHIKGSGGAYADTRMYSSNMGAARRFSDSKGKGNLIFAPTIDYGGGRYASYLNNGTSSDGDAHYWAGGLLARKTFDSGFYFGGSFRYGRVTSDYESSDLWPDKAMTVKYDSASKYYSGHLDFGRILDIDHENKLDVYGIYFFSHIGGASAYVTDNEKYSFNSVSSHRARVGARLTRYMGKNNRFYSGIAYQYESIGEARGRHGDVTVSDGGVSGSSGMLELGWQFKPEPNAPIAINVSATGWVGHQRGASIQAKFERSF